MAVRPSSDRTQETDMYTWSILTDKRGNVNEIHVLAFSTSISDLRDATLYARQSPAHLAPGLAGLWRSE